MRLTIDKNELEQLATDAIKQRLATSVDYSNLREITDRVIKSRSAELELFLGECMDSVLADSGFRAILVQEFQHKVAKRLVSDLEGSVDKATNAFRNDPTRKARMILALETIIEEEPK